MDDEPRPSHKASLAEFALRAQVKRMQRALRKSDRLLIKERLENEVWMRKMRVLLLAGFRVIAQARNWTDANGFGAGDPDAAWLQLYQSICDWDKEVERQLKEETDDENHN